MPLTLITGPANAAKAGAVFERLRAALPRDPLLVVPTGADREHYQRELAASGIVFGAEVLTFDAARAGDRRRGAGWACARSGRSRATASCGRRWPACRCGRSPARRPRRASPRRRRAVRRARSARSSRPRGSRRRCARGRRRPRRRLRRRARPRSTPRTGAGSERLGRPDREGYAWAALDALRAAPGRVGRAARLPLRLRRPHADAARRGRDALAPRRAPTSCVALPYEPGRVAFAGRAATVEELRPLAAEVVAPARALRALRAVRAAGAAPPRALAVRAGRRAGARPTARSGCSRPAASAPRPSWSAPRCSS